MSADKHALGKLHAKIAEKLTDAIDEMATDTKGLAAILNVARQFCKDNGIEAIPVAGSPLGTLADKVAEFPFDPAEDSRAH